MEPTTNINLTWDNHQTTLVTVFEALLANEKLADCTVSAEGKSIKAHKIILAACSPYFEQVFTENQEKHPIIILPGVKFQVMKALLDFMYHGELSIRQDYLGSVLTLSEFFQLKGLSGSGYIADMDTPVEDGASQLLIPPENHSPQPTISSVFTLCPQETGEMESMNSFKEHPLIPSSQENNSVRTDSITRVSRKRKKPTRKQNKSTVRRTSNGGMGPASINKAISTDAGELDIGAVSVRPLNNQLQGSTFNQRIFNEGASCQMASGTKFANKVGTPVGITKDVTLSGMYDSVNSSDVSMAAHLTVKDVCTKRGRAAKCQPVQSRKKQHRKLNTKFTCHLCGKSYLQRSGLARHVLYECGKQPQFQCPRCKRFCSRKYDLRKHMLSRRCLSYLKAEDKQGDENKL